jgi:hypothetical protein
VTQKIKIAGETPVPQNRDHQLEVPLRVPHPLWFSKSGDLDVLATGQVGMHKTKIPTLAKTARMGHPAKPKPYHLPPAA